MVKDSSSSNQPQQTHPPISGRKCLEIIMAEEAKSGQQLEADEVVNTIKRRWGVVVEKSTVYNYRSSINKNKSLTAPVRNSKTDSDVVSTMDAKESMKMAMEAARALQPVIDQWRQRGLSSQIIREILEVAAENLS